MPKIQFKNNGTQGSNMVKQANDIYDLSQKSGFNADPYMEAIVNSIQRKDERGFAASINALNTSYNNHLAGKNDAGQLAANIAEVKSYGLPKEQVDAITKSLATADSKGASAILANVRGQAAETNKLNTQQTLDIEKKKDVERFLTTKSKHSFISNIDNLLNKIDLLYEGNTLSNITGFYGLKIGQHKQTPSDKYSMDAYDAVKEASANIGLGLARDAGSGARMSNAMIASEKGSLVDFQPGEDLAHFGQRMEGLKKRLFDYKRNTQMELNSYYKQHPDEAPDFNTQQPAPTSTPTQQSIDSVQGILNQYRQNNSTIPTSQNTPQQGQDQSQGQGQVIQQGQGGYQDQGQIANNQSDSYSQA